MLILCLPSGAYSTIETLFIFSEKKKRLIGILRKIPSSKWVALVTPFPCFSFSFSFYFLSISCCNNGKKKLNISFTWVLMLMDVFYCAPEKDEILY